MSTFEKCTSLTQITLPDGIEELFNTFSDCTGLTHVQLPASLGRIDCGAFRFCFALKQIALPEKLTYLGIHSFFYSGLEQVAFPAGTIPATGASKI